MSQPRILFYVQHLLGIGHLVRASRIAAAMVDYGLHVTVVMGGMPVAGFPGSGVDLVCLPPIKAADQQFSALTDADGRPADEALWGRRRSTLVALLQERRPDVVLIEAFPFGRRQMRAELLPFLDAARALQPRPLVVSSVRDVLQENRRAGRAAETIATLSCYFDRVLVHGDPTFARLDETFPQASEIADLIAYTGLVSGPTPPPPSEHFAIIVSAGGGAAGASLLQHSLSAAERLARRDAPWCVITGPNSRYVGQAPQYVRIESFRADFPSLLRGAQLSISQAGYNTVCDILRAGPRSILVPFAEGGETEQTRRAERLAARGLTTLIPEPLLDVDRLAGAIGEALAMERPKPHGLDLNGARHSAEIVGRDLAIKRAR